MRRFSLSVLLTLTSVAAALPETAQVREGETLYRIATRHGLSVDELKRLNGLKSNIIEIGQVLRLTPAKAPPVKATPVKPAPPKGPVANAKTPPPAKPAATGRSDALPATYTVRSGDTLASISLRVGLSVPQLRRLNGLKGDALEAGQLLRLRWPPPAARSPALPARPPAPATYTVRAGDTLGKISPRVGLSVEQLRRLNNLQGEALEAGQLLRLQWPTPPKTAQAKPATPAAAPSTYTVRQGDTLARISPRVGLSVEQLRRLNGLRGDRLLAGQVLQLRWSASGPGVKAAPGTYVVRLGDTLDKVSPRVGLSVAQLRQLNGLRGDRLSAGQVLRLRWPAGRAPLQAFRAPGTYTVRPGDTLGTISPLVGLSAEQLRRLNGLKGSDLQAGQVLRLKWPTPPKAVAKKAAPPTTYTVRSGDTLARISPRVGLSVDQLRRLNGLEGNVIRAGQVLRLSWPAQSQSARSAQSGAPSAPTRYVVRAGDTLGVIAARSGVSVASLQAANGLSGSVIRVGQTLRIPPRGAVLAGGRPAPLPPGTEARLIYRYVRVGLRDNAASLAQTYRITPDELRRINGFSSRRVIMPGMRVLVPQRVAVPVPPRPVRSPVTFRRAAPLGIPVQVVQVDLRHRSVLVSPVLPRQGLSFGAGARVSVLAARSGAQAVVNGSYFHPGSYAPAGDIVMQGRMLTWGRIPAALAITPDNRAQISPSTSALLGRPLESTWSGMETVIATGPQIVRGGVVQNRYSSVFRDPAVFGQAARSAVGLSSSRDLMLVSTHAKLSVGQMGKVMAALGARDALLLDGGSSAGLAWNGAAVLDSVRKVSYGIGVFSNYTGRRYSR